MRLIRLEAAVNFLRPFNGWVGVPIEEGGDQSRPGLSAGFIGQTEVSVSLTYTSVCPRLRTCTLNGRG